MTHSCVEVYLQIIFSTKDRKPLISPEIENRLHCYIAGIAKKRKVNILKINGTSDHIHILLKMHPSVSIATLVKEIKAYSTGWIKKCGHLQFEWQEGYGGFSYSKSSIPAVCKYIENQKEHQRKRSFEEEIELIKKRLDIQWDIA